MPFAMMTAHSRRYGPPVHHAGLCRIPLGATDVDGQVTIGAVLREHALGWTEGLDEFDDIREIAREVLARPHVALGHSHAIWTELDIAELDAVATIAREYGAYVVMCGYDTDEDDEIRRVYALLHDGGGVTECWAHHP